MPSQYYLCSLHADAHSTPKYVHFVWCLLNVHVCAIDLQLSRINDTILERTFWLVQIQSHAKKLFNLTILNIFTAGTGTGPCVDTFTRVPNTQSLGGNVSPNTNGVDNCANRCRSMV